VSVRVFAKPISICTDELSKADGPPPGGLAPFSLLRD
jgi:hypothetical protein